jgi:cytochrome c5
MKRLLTVLAWILLLGSSVRLLARPQSPANGPQPQKGATSTSSAKKSPDSKEGERRFQQNCGRCHIAPEAISPREAKAVLQHMRVRASLSAEDEELILHFIAP